MENITIIHEIQCTSYDDENVKHIYKVYVKTLVDAININRCDYTKLEEIRKELVCTVMHIETLQADIKYGPGKKY